MESVCQHGVSLFEKFWENIKNSLNTNIGWLKSFCLSKDINLIFNGLYKQNANSWKAKTSLNLVEKKFIKKISFYKNLSL